MTSTITLILSHYHSHCEKTPLLGSKRELCLGQKGLTVLHLQLCPQRPGQGEKEALLQSVPWLGDNCRPGTSWSPDGESPQPTEEHTTGWARRESD